MAISITLKAGLSKTLTTEVEANTTVNQVLGNADYKAVLKFGENVRAVVDGTTLNGDDTFSDGDVVQIETRANSKAVQHTSPAGSTISITLKAGLSKSLATEICKDVTAGEVLRDPSYKAVLKFGENVRAVVNGTTLNDDDKFSDGDVVQIETRANSKA